MLTDDQLIRLLQQLEPGAGPDRATLERMFERVDAERARRRRNLGHRWPAGVARLIPRVAAPVVMLAVLLTVLFGLTLGMWVGGSTPGPKVAPSLAPPPLRPPATVIAPAARISLAGRPGTVINAAGSIWVANGGQVDRIDPATGRITATVQVGSSRAGLAAGGAGIWVCDVDDGTVARLDPVSGQIGPKVAVSKPEYIAVGDQDIWVASPKTGLVTRIDAATNRVVASIEGGHGPSQLVATADAVWVPNDQSVIDSASLAEARAVTRIDPTTNTVVGTIPGGDHTYARQAMVAEGQIWVLDNGAGRIARIDPATNAIVQEITIGGNPGGMVLVGDVIWVTAQPTDEQGLVVQVDPATSTATTSFGVSGTASSTSGLSSLTADGTSLWVAADWSDSHELLMIDSP